MAHLMWLKYSIQIVMHLCKFAFTFLPLNFAVANHGFPTVKLLLYSEIYRAGKLLAVLNFTEPFFV